jgi:hypothetical protein
MWTPAAAELKGICEMKTTKARWTWPDGFEAPEQNVATLNDSGPVWAGKTVWQLTRKELIKCALHFRDAHLSSWIQAANTERRMRHMEEVLTRAELDKLGRWLKYHDVIAQDCEWGDGRPFFKRWYEDWEGLGERPRVPRKLRENH